MAEAWGICPQLKHGSRCPGCCYYPFTINPNSLLPSTHISYRAQNDKQSFGPADWEQFKKIFSSTDPDHTVAVYMNLHHQLLAGCEMG